MGKKLLYIIYKVTYLFDLLLIKTINKSFLLWFKNFIEQDSYTSVKIINNNIKFFIPNHVSKWRVDTFFSKEPETIDWINNFNNHNKIIFWDIGANIGLFSIYAAFMFDKIEVISFEPSTSNLRILSRNISINNLENKIKINQFPLTEKQNQYLLMKENDFVEGGALNSFGENFNFEGKVFKSKNNYKIYGTSIDFILKNNILDIPNYIKIDVDGIEHLILRGAKDFINNKNIKGLLIELNVDFKKQYNEVMQIMENSNFILINKKQSNLINNSKKFSNTYNCIFSRKN